MVRTALFLAAFDSQLKWCGLVRDELARRGFSWQVVVPDVRSALSADQIAAAGFDRVSALSWSATLDAALAADVVVSGLSGPTNESLLADLDERLRAPGHPAGGGPVTVTGWVGVIIENRTAGYLNRCGADVVAVNSRSDLAHFRGVAERLELPAENLLLTGLPLLVGRSSAAGRPARPDRVARVLFADQPTVPRGADDRRYLYDRLLDYARAHPDREVRLRPRHRLGEDTFHRMRHHPESLLADVELPSNFGITHRPIAELLPETDLLLTVSSSACLEALEAGCRVALPLDLGVHEKLGNHVFLDSGLLATFDQIIADDLGRPEPAWLADHLLAESTPPAVIIADRVEELLGSGQRPSLRTRDSHYYRTAAAFNRAVTGPRQRSLVAAVGAGGGWRRRVAAVGHAVLPPVLVRPVRRLAHSAGVLR